MVGRFRMSHNENFFHNGDLSTPPRVGALDLLRRSPYRVSMWTKDEYRFEAVKHAEIALMLSSVRKDRGHLERVLASDFVEIGRSGHRWTLDETLRALTTEDSHESPHVSEWLFNEIKPGLVLVTYLARTSNRESRHSSLWDVTSEQPTLRFHQGTILPRAD